MKSQHERLFAEFPITGATEWEARINEDLKGADYEKKLIWKTLENLRIKPYYTAEDLIDLPYMQEIPGNYPFTRGGKTGSNSWEIRQDFRVFDVGTAVAKAQAAIDRGATAVGFDLTAKGDLYYHDFRKLINGLAGKPVSLNFITGENARDMLDYLVRVFEEQGNHSVTLSGSMGYDPLGQLTSTGGYYRSAGEDLEAAGMMVNTVEKWPDFRILSIGSNLFSDSGASLVQELAYGLAMAAEYLNRLTDIGHSAVDVSRHMQWNLGAGSSFFMEIAKIRAARLLFSALLSAYDSDHSKFPAIFIHSITTSWNKTLYDPNVNMLRLTTEAMAAILGGCNSLTVKPYDSWYKEPGDFSERIARNIQIILKEESYLDKVVDPAAGSYYIESLTDGLVENAWQLFLKVDEQGGYVRSFMAGKIQEDIHKTVSRRSELVSSRREVLVGTNQYPNFQETISDQVDPEIAFLKPADNPDRLAEPLVIGRAAEGFEKLRLASEKQKGGRPRVFMLTFGNLAMRLARSQFSCNFFACAGYAVTDNLGFSSAKEGVEAAMKARADIIVVCSSDEEYALIVPEVAALAGDKAIVVVAGAPACMDELRQKGITEFIHVRSNVLETLSRFHAKLGIA